MLRRIYLFFCFFLDILYFFQVNLWLTNANRQPRPHVTLCLHCPMENSYSFGIHR